MDQPDPSKPSQVPAVVPSLSAGPFKLLSVRVLVVEDDPLNQHLIRRMLEKHLDVALGGDLWRIARDERIVSGFYISQALEVARS